MCIGLKYSANTRRLPVLARTHSALKNLPSITTSGNASVVKSRVSNPHFQAFPGMPNVQFNEKSEFLSPHKIFGTVFDFLKI